MKTDPDHPAGLSAQIADAIRDAIISGDLIVDERLPSEAELAEQFDVSRPTIREALKRLAAQSLIRTQRGAFGGAFVRRLSYEDAREQHVTTSTLLLSMNSVSFVTACEARFALERACSRLASARRGDEQLNAMQHEIGVQGREGLSDEDFCASDVAFHRALVDAAQNPVLSYQLIGAIEAMQPLMNMITFTARSREEIIAIHTNIVAALTDRDPVEIGMQLERLESYTKELAVSVASAKSSAVKDKAKPKDAALQLGPAE